MENDNTVHETTNYNIFKLVAGNRDVDKNHVKSLAKLMAINGNLTGEFPIVVNESMEVMDGQHRLTALKQLNWPVYYQVRKTLTLDQVRAINVGHRNWNWIDYARSYANLGNKNYERFLVLAQKYPLGYGALSQFAGFLDNRDILGRSQTTFRNGGLTFNAEHYKRADDLLSEWVGVRAYIPKPTAAVAKAFHRITQNPNYDHKRMLDKMEKFANRIFNEKWVNLTITDAARAFEEVYNFHSKEEVRLY